MEWRNCALCWVLVVPEMTIVSFPLKEISEGEGMRNLTLANPEMKMALSSSVWNSQVRTNCDVLVPHIVFGLPNEYYPMRVRGSGFY